MILYEDENQKIEISDFIHEKLEDMRRIKPRFFTDYTPREFKVWKYLTLKTLNDEGVLEKEDNIIISNKIIILEPDRVYTFVDSFREFEPVVELLQKALTEEESVSDCLNSIETEENINGICFRECDKIDFALVSKKGKDIKILFFKVDNDNFLEEEEE